jgi:hypothetical protein
MTTAWMLLLFFLGACGDDGNNDTIWTGLSGVIIAVVLVVIILRWLRKRG